MPAFLLSFWSWLHSPSNDAKVTRGAIVALTGVLLTYLTQWVAGVDFGPTWTPIIGMISSVAANSARKWLGVLEAYEPPAESGGEE